MKTRTFFRLQEKDAIEEFKVRLERGLGRRFVTIKLFGSRAKGKYRKGSDIDLLIIITERTPWVEDFIIDARLELLNKYGVYPEIVTYSRKEYEKYKRMQSPFIINLERDGVPL